MKDLLDGFLKEHAELRRAMAAMARLLGKAEGVGWDDQMNLDLRRLKEAERQFSAMLKVHERMEEDRFSDLLRRLASEGELPPQAL